MLSELRSVIDISQPNLKPIRNQATMKPSPNNLRRFPRFVVNSHLKKSNSAMGATTTTANETSITRAMGKGMSGKGS